MKGFFHLLIFIFPFSLFAVNDDVFIQKIQRAQTKTEKENLYISWITDLSQSNTLQCDTIIQQKNDFIDELSDEGKLAVLLIYLNNSRLGGSTQTPVLEDYHLNPIDLLLIEGLVKCFKRATISKSEFQNISKHLKSYSDPTRSSIYYSVYSCVEGISKEEKITHFNTALKHSTRSHLKGIFSSILDVFSSYYLEIEDFEQAILHQQKGVTYTKKHNLKGNLLNHLISIGYIQFQMGNLEKSEEALLQALELSSDLKMEFVQGQLYNRLGKLYGAQEKLDKSIRFYQLALLRFYAIDNTEGLAITHKDIGKMFFLEGSIDLAEKNYRLSEEFNKKINKAESKGELFYLMAELYFAKNQMSLAEENILKAMDFWDKNELSIPLNESYYLFAKIKHQQGDLNHAYLSLNRYLNFRDSVHSLETRKKVAELSEMFESEQKERKIAEQERKLEEEFSQRLFVQNKLESSKQENRLVIVILIISLILFVTLFVLIRNRNKQEQLIKKQREIELQQTVMRTQMNPHFIFNAMSVIQSYIYDKDVVNSSKFLIHFSKLMRMILENNAKQFIPLETELEIINRYLVLQKMRFEDRFDFEILEDDIDDPTLISIPPMLVQPFIENSIEHGDLDKVGNGLIQVSCEIVEDLFIFTVKDNGIGRQKALQKKKAETSENHRSMAIELTQSRIELLNEKYKSKGYLLIEDIETQNNSGTKVTIVIPYIKNL